MKPLAPPCTVLLRSGSIIGLAAMILASMVLSAGPASAQRSDRFSSPDGFSLNVPDGWQVMTKEQGQAITDDLKARTKFNPSRMAAMLYSPTDPRVNINIIVLPGAVPLDDDAANGYASMLRDQAGQAGVAISAFTVTRHSYAQHPSLLADYEMDFTNSNGPNKDLGKVHQWQVVFSGSTNTYVVTCSASVMAFSTIAPVFERVLNSMEYTGMTPTPAVSAPVTPAAPPVRAPVTPAAPPVAAQVTPSPAAAQPPAQPPAQPQVAPTLAPAPVATPTQTSAQTAAQAPEGAPAPNEAGAAHVQFVDARSNVKPVRMYTPKENDVYCAGFITNTPPISDLYVITGAEGGLQEIFIPGNAIYLSRGAGNIMRPGGEYMLLRAIVDPEYRMEWFTGQNRLLKSLGTVYSEVGRVRIDIVHEYVSTAKVLSVCGEILPGDIAVPINLKPTPPAPREVFDRFAPSSNKNEGIIATGKEFEGSLSAGKIVYLSIGADKGVEVGQQYRIYRTFATSADDPNRRYLENTPTELFKMRINYKLSKAQRAVLPRDILGEMVILSVQGKSATALITMSGAEIFPGDQVELK
jgi:hypothetical protein